MDTPAPTEFSVRPVIGRDTILLRLAGDLDMASAPELRASVDQLPPCSQIVIDLQDVTFMDSTGLAVLISVLGPDTPPLKMIPGRRNVQRVFEITKTADQFDWMFPG